MTSRRFALLVDLILSRLGAAVVILLLVVLAITFTLGVFPRTLLGVLLLIIVGGPLCLVADALREAHPVGGLLGIVVLLVLVLWWCERHAAFMHQNFF